MYPSRGFWLGTYLHLVIAKLENTEPKFYSLDYF